MTRPPDTPLDRARALLAAEREAIARFDTGRLALLAAHKLELVAELASLTKAPGHHLELQLLRAEAVAHHRILSELATILPHFAQTRAPTYDARARLTPSTFSSGSHREV